MNEISQEEAKKLLDLDKDTLTGYIEMLEPLTSVKKGDKIGCNNDVIVVYGSSLLQGLRRWYNDENRYKSFYLIRSVLDKYIRYINDHVLHIDKAKIKELNKKLIFAFQQLSFTYSISNFLSQEYSDLALSLSSLNETLPEDT